VSGFMLNSPQGLFSGCLASGFYGKYLIAAKIVQEK